uniref:Uncharacterized protein n=1 Tax=Populus trichocarpa TaxID=3694 RepID=B9I1T0_POPTR
MILKSFIPDNLVSFCMKINNLIIVFVLYYGFLITFSMKTSYLFLLQAWGIEEGTKKKIYRILCFISSGTITNIFFCYGSISRNSMCNLSIQYVFLNNLIFQLFNNFILSLSILVIIYMFHCTNKMLFVTNSFFG